jgi:hypothetical protein
MRLILTFLIPFIFNSCKPGQSEISQVSSKTAATFCPEDGKCELHVLKNSQLLIKKDEFGATYPHVEAGNFIVLKFEYKKDEIPNTADSNYSELVYIQLNPDSLEMELKDKNLSNVKLLFGRLCFCRGQTGYYRINSGHLSIKNIEENTYQINLEFTTDQVPQIITRLHESIQL